jgi:excisionase family DNA binding protein
MTTVDIRPGRALTEPAGLRTEVVWTVQAVQGLGVTTDVETAAAILGIGRTKAYELAKNGEFPIKIVRVGRRYVVPVQAILHLLDAA